MIRTAVGNNGDDQHRITYLTASSYLYPIADRIVVGVISLLGQVGRTPSPTYLQTLDYCETSINRFWFPIFAIDLLGLRHGRTLCTRAGGGHEPTMA
jgi:hypothetical protein